jgi:hypothetical protein
MAEMAATQAPMSSEEGCGQCRDQDHLFRVLSARLRSLCISFYSYIRETLLSQVCLAYVNLYQVVLLSLRHDASSGCR